LNKGIIELNDAAIRIGINGEHVHTSVGYAVLDQQHLMVGTEAQQKAKLFPRWTNNRFWNQLGTDSISNATSNIRHHADLALAHLDAINALLTADAVVIGVPAFFDKAQLGLLLGLCKEAGIPVTSLVDLSVLSVANQPSHPNALFLDVGLHRVTLTSLRTDGAIRQTGHQTLLDMGLATFWDRWASLIAEQFIQSSRFDPMHEAASEQQLFNQLPEFIANSGNQRNLTFELNLGQVKHTTPLSKDQLLGATSGAYPAIVQGIRQQTNNQPTSLFVSSRFNGFPELATSLALIPDLEITYLNSDHVVRGANELWGKLGTTVENVSHITTLALSSAKPESNVSEKQASHLLVGHNAYSLRQARQISGVEADQLLDDGSPICSVSLERDGLKLRVLGAGLSINQTPLDSGTHTLSPGDTIGINGRLIQVIAEQ
jgi:hypothetical protein